MIYFWLVKIELQMPMDKDFAADYVASWRTRATRNYNAFPDLEDFFEGDSARCLLAVFGVYSSFGHSCGVKLRSSGRRDIWSRSGSSRR